MYGVINSWCHKHESRTLNDRDVERIVNGQSRSPMASNCPRWLAEARREFDLISNAQTPCASKTTRTPDRV